MSDVPPPTSRRAAREAAAAAAAAAAETARMPVPTQAMPAADAAPTVPYGSDPALASPVSASASPFGAMAPTSSGGGPAAPEPVAGEPGPAEPIDRTRRLRIGIIIGASALAFILACTGSVFLGMSVGRNSADQTTTTGGTTDKRVVPANRVQPTQIPTCSLDSLASDSSLIKLYGSVVQTATGDAIYSNGDTTGVRPSSVLKVLTAAAAVSALGPTFQITTSVDQTTTPGTIVLIGQGDATLSRVAAGQSVYAGAPTLADLASKTLAAYNAIPANAGVPIQNVILDSTYWNPSDNWDSSVPTTLRSSGYLSETTALQVDGDRQNPSQQISPRSNDPIDAAGTAFIQALGLNPSSVTMTQGSTPSGSSQLASVQSQPVSVLVKQMLRQNDDTLAEMLARIVSIKENLAGTSASIQQAITTALGTFGLDTSQLTIEDGSGESDESQIPPLFMSKFMSLVSQQTNGLQYVAAGLPVAGKSGNLSGRFTGANAVVSGKITGIAGIQSDADTISGYVTAADGTGESFTFFAEGAGITSKANTALDTLAAAVYQCGKNITSN